MPTTELWLTPLILLPGVALLIMSTSARLHQINSEFHHLLDHPDDHAKIISLHLVQRSAFFRDALVCLYSSVCFFSFGSLIGGVFNLLIPQLLWIVGGLTILGIMTLVYASFQLVRESFLCTKIIKDHRDRIENLASLQK
ncbi:MAG: DUF2721 domain-containing protein [SAR324 cluster bacterium]|nr:DUF2721 domain-containing protein [SAR324 cluster bacterium]